MITFALVMVLLSGDGDMVEITFDNNFDQTQCMVLADEFRYTIQSDMLVATSFCVEQRDA